MSENETPANAGEGAGASGVAGEGNEAGAGTAATGAGEGEGEGGEGGGTPSEDDELKSLGLDPSDKRGLKTRFTTLTDLSKQHEKAAEEARQQADHWKAIAEAKAGGAQTPPVNQQQPDANAAPDPKDKTKYPLGADDPQYIEDKAVHRIRQENAAAHTTQQREAEAKRDWEKRRDNFFAAKEKATKNADTPAAAAQLGAMPSLFVDILAESEHPDLIAQHFATNKAEYEALYKQHIVAKVETRQTRDGLKQVEAYYWRTPGSSLAFAKKVGSLESSLPGAFAARKQTKAGQVPDTVGAGAGAGGAKQPKDMDVDELDAWLRKKKAAAG